MDYRVKEMQERNSQVEEKYREIHQEMQSKLYDIEKKKK